MGNAVIEQVMSEALRFYKMAGFVVPHYGVNSAVLQKISALAQRTETQARDIFDINLLSTQYSKNDYNAPKLAIKVIKASHENVFNVSFAQFRDTVVNYLRAEDQKTYDSEDVWDDIQLKMIQFIKD